MFQRQCVDSGGAARPLSHTQTPLLRRPAGGARSKEASSKWLVYDVSELQEVVSLRNAGQEIIELHRQRRRFSSACL